MAKYKYPNRSSFLYFLFNSSAIAENPIKFHKKIFTNLGDSFYLKPPFGKPIMLTKDAEIAKEILQKKHKIYQKSKLQTRSLSKYLGYGLLTATGSYWLQQRRLIQPAFHKEKIASLVAIIHQKIEEESAKIKPNATLELYPLMHTIAFEVIASSLFYFSEDISELNKFQEIIEKLQHFIIKKIRQPHKKLWYIISLQQAESMKLVKEGRAIINKIIQSRKNQKERHDDLLDMLIHATYEDGTCMTNEQLIDEIMILFVAGHETTANALTFTLFLLAKNQRELKIAQEESVHVQDNKKGMEIVTNLNYIKKCIEESMRLYPPAWITDRVALEDDNLGKYHIEKGTLLGISIYEMHRNENYWHQPEMFIPERFSEENKKEIIHYYMPFGAGPRLCIGNNFAMYEMMLVVNTIINKFDLSTTDKTVAVNPLITLKPVGVTIKFIPRNNG